MIPLQNDTNDPPVRVSAWTKIILEISKSICKSNDTSLTQTNRIQVNTRNCKIDASKVDLSNLVNEENIPFILSNPLLSNKAYNGLYSNFNHIVRKKQFL